MRPTKCAHPTQTSSKLCKNSIWITGENSYWGHILTIFRFLQITNVYKLQMSSPVSKSADRKLYFKVHHNPAEDRRLRSQRWLLQTRYVWSTRINFFILVSTLLRWMRVYTICFKCLGFLLYICKVLFWKIAEMWKKSAFCKTHLMQNTCTTKCDLEMFLSLFCFVIYKDIWHTIT